MIISHRPKAGGLWLDCLGLIGSYDHVGVRLSSDRFTAVL